MKSQVKSILQRTRRFLSAPVIESQKKIAAELRSSKEVQILLSLKYKEMASRGVGLPAFDEVEFRAYSQNGEDGILLYIFSLIGTANKKVVEICAADGLECNAANLIINHGWTGLLFDGDRDAVERGRAFYARCPDTFLWPPVFVNAWVTAENVDSLISGNGLGGEIDLLSLDIDGNDYWIWKAINCVRPRVVVLEYNNLWGPDRSVTMPYTPDFRAEHGEFGMDYGGASLQAFVKLGREKGYRLVGWQRYGFNAFFVRSGVGEDVLPEAEPSAAFQHPFARHAMNARLPAVRDKGWVEV